MPYKFEVINEIVGDAKFIVNKESELKNKINKFKYIPSIKFNGMYECFSVDCINELTNNIR